jgi:hypothetical protein
MFCKHLLKRYARISRVDSKCRVASNDRNANSYRECSNSRDASNRYPNSRAIAGNSDAKGTDVT